MLLIRNLGNGSIPSEVVWGQVERSFDNLLLRRNSWRYIIVSLATKFTKIDNVYITYQIVVVLHFMFPISLPVWV